MFDVEPTYRAARESVEERDAEGTLPQAAAMPNDACHQQGVLLFRKLYLNDHITEEDFNAATAILGPDREHFELQPNVDRWTIAVFGHAADHAFNKEPSL